MFFAKVVRRVCPDDPTINEANPINELHLHPIKEASLSIKMPSGYRMVSSTLLHTDGVSSYLIKRMRRRDSPGNDPSSFRYKAQILSCYPSISQGASFNTLKLLFPDGCEVSPVPAKPMLQSCYITVSDDSLDVHMLTFVKYWEKASADFSLTVS